SDHQPSPFWLAAVEPHEQPQPIATLVTAFTMLGKGNALFVATGYGHKETSSEAFVLDRGRKATWNLLEDVKRLPALDKKFADKDYIEDRLIVRPLESFGTNDHEPLAFCLLTHSRGDRRAFAGLGPRPSDRLDSISWRRAMVVTTTGERYMT